MSEWNLVWLTIPRILILLVFVLLYVIGGRKWKPLRRIVGGTFLGASVTLMALAIGNYHWIFWLSVPLYPVALSLGYGGNDTQTKFVRRLIYGVSLGSVSFVFLNPVLAIFQVSMSTLASIYLGLRNPVQAVNEEAMIALLSVATVPFMI